MRCLNCGNALPDGARFCGNCGTPVGGTPADGAPGRIPGNGLAGRNAYGGYPGDGYTAPPVQGKKGETESETMTETEEIYDAAEGGVHRYEYFVDDCTWNEAFEKAQESGGYLAHINTPEEYEHILSEIEGQGYENIQFRIGGRREADSSGYFWVDEDNRLYGERINSPEYWADAEWMQGEPSYTDGQNEEEYIDICYYSKEKRWVWNDVPDDIIAVVPYYSGKVGYIVEYEER